MSLNQSPGDEEKRRSNESHVGKISGVKGAGKEGIYCVYYGGGSGSGDDETVDRGIRAAGGGWDRAWGAVFGSDGGWADQSAVGAAGVEAGGVAEACVGDGGDVAKRKCDAGGFVHVFQSGVSVWDGAVCGGCGAFWGRWRVGVGRASGGVRGGFQAADGRGRAGYGVSVGSDEHGGADSVGLGLGVGVYLLRVEDRGDGRAGGRGFEPSSDGG